VADTVTIRGDIPGLIRGCSPVWFTREAAGSLVQLSGVVVAVEDGRAIVASRGIGPLTGSRWLHEVRLNLGDDTGLLHAAWWVDEHFDYLVGKYGWSEALTKAHVAVECRSRPGQVADPNNPKKLAALVEELAELVKNFRLVKRGEVTRGA
jgi:hypothetical protein